MAAGHWHPKQYLDAHWEDHHWAVGAAVAPSSPPTPSPGIGRVVTPSVTIRPRRLVLHAGAAQVYLEIPPARCLIAPARVPLRLRAGHVALGLQVGAAHALIAARALPIRVHVPSAPAIGVGSSRARAVVTEAGDETLALMLLGLL